MAQSSTTLRLPGGRPRKDLAPLPALSRDQKAKIRTILGKDAAEFLRDWATIRKAVFAFGVDRYLDQLSFQPGIEQRQHQTATALAAILEALVTLDAYAAVAVTPTIAPNASERERRAFIRHHNKIGTFTRRTRSWIEAEQRLLDLARQQLPARAPLPRKPGRTLRGLREQCLRTVLCSYFEWRAQSQPAWKFTTTKTGRYARLTAALLSISSLSPYTLGNVKRTRVPAWLLLKQRADATIVAPD
jgi:hypothetical protein